MVFGGVKEVGEVKRQQSKVVRSIHARVHFPQEPFVVVEDALSVSRILRQRISSESRSQDVGRSSMNIIMLIQLPLCIWQHDHNSQILPHICIAQFQSFADLFGSSQSSSGNLMAFGEQHSFSFQSIEIFGEAAAIGAKVVAFDK